MQKFIFKISEFRLKTFFAYILNEESNDKCNLLIDDIVYNKKIKKCVQRPFWIKKCVERTDKMDGNTVLSLHGIEDE